MIDIALDYLYFFYTLISMYLVEDELTYCYKTSNYTYGDKILKADFLDCDDEVAVYKNDYDTRQSNTTFNIWCNNTYSL